MAASARVFFLNYQNENNDGDNERNPNGYNGDERMPWAERNFD